MKLFRKDEGFTLVELMVVVLIIGILVAIAVPIFNSAKASAQKRACQSNMRAVEGAYQTYYADLADLPAGFTAPAAGPIANLDAVNGGTFTPEYMKALKNCPTAQAVYTFAYSGTGTTAIDVLCNDANFGGAAGTHNAR
jgi:prepilin-type N-terminal cleavage/methylation domain-containing protein